MPHQTVNGVIKLIVDSTVFNNDDLRGLQAGPLRSDDVSAARHLSQPIDDIRALVVAQVLGAGRVETGIVDGQGAGRPAPDVAVAGAVAAREVEGVAVGKAALHALDGQAVGEDGRCRRLLELVGILVQLVLNDARVLGVRVRLVLADQQAVGGDSPVQGDPRVAEGEVGSELVPAGMVTLVLAY